MWINAPITPPDNIYHGLTCQIPWTSGLPVNNHMTRQVTNAVSCTQPADTQMLLCLVTSVLNTPLNAHKRARKQRNQNTPT